MADLFRQVLELSVKGSWLILAVCALRPLLRRAPRWSVCLLWLPAGLRLAWPFSFESPLSLVPRAASLPMADAARGAASAGSLGAAPAAGSLGAAPAAGSWGLADVLACLWLAGLAAMLAYALASWLRLRLLVREAAPAGEGCLACDRVRSPFILGLFRPRIYLPSALAEPERSFAAAHERAHLRRLDPLWKLLGWLLLSAHWFNPLAWLAYALFCRDVEAACDERVVRGLDEEGRRAYARALVACSSPRRAVIPPAFGETGVKARVRGVLKYKKPALWALMAAAAACAVLAACFLTEPAPEPAAPALPEGLSLSDHDGDTQLILPMAYEDTGSAPDYWRSSGLIADFDAERALLRGEDGQIAEVLIYSNHMQIECLGPVTGLDAPAYLTRNTYDLCTAAEAAGGEVPTSTYWCVYIAEPGASTGRLVSLDAAQFTPEDTVRLAQSIHPDEGLEELAHTSLGS